MFQRSRIENLILMIGGAVGVFLLVFPLVTLVARSIDARGWEGIANSGLEEAIRISFLTTAITVIINLVIGTPLAYLLARWKFRLRRLIMVLVELPLVLPPAVAGLALLISFGRRSALGSVLTVWDISIPFTTVAVIMAQVFVSLPLYVRAAQVGFQSIPREIEMAAQVDGANGFALFRTITLPLASRSLLAGLTLSWTRALGEFGATILFAGNLRGVTQTMPLLVYGLFERNLDTAMWAAVILGGLAFGALIVSHWLTASANSESDILV